MITVSELMELKAMLKRFGELFPRIEALPMTCNTCCEFKGGFCNVHKEDVPEEFRVNGCEKWDWLDIPF